MAASYTDRQTTGTTFDGSARRLASEEDERLAPVIAGAHARGMADMLDLLGVPAVFLDRSGEVLFESRAATVLLSGDGLEIRMRHLVARDADDNQRLSAFLANALDTGAPAVNVRLPASRVVLRTLPRSEAVALTGQLLRTVVLIDRAEAPLIP